jgi:aspartyl-tRNA(Asn)/glutamyl-tRNA(Gln) amidotransferase subunit A
LELLEQHGAEIKVISVPLVKYTLPYHYSLLPSEAASNLARYDGIRYGHQSDLLARSQSQADVEDHQSDLFEYIADSKTHSFGMNVKRRVVLGNFLMSSGGGQADFNSKLVDAQRYRRMLIQEYTDVMRSEDLDFVIAPNGFGEKPPKISDILAPDTTGEAKSPVFEYKHDYFTVIANCLGVPAVTMPLFEDEAAKATYDNFPGSIRMQGYFGEDFHLLRTAQKIERIFAKSGMGVS